MTVEKFFYKKKAPITICCDEGELTLHQLILRLLLGAGDLDLGKVLGLTTLNFFKTFVNARRIGQHPRCRAPCVPDNVSVAVTIRVIVGVASLT